MCLKSGKLRDYSRLDIQCPICRGWFPYGAKHSDKCSSVLDEVMVAAAKSQSQVLRRLIDG